jgi:hypothetical protein
MANISTYLAAIMNAVYGQDVRGSIHDAIDIINQVSEVVLTTGTAVTGPTSSSTGFFTDSLYLNTNTMELWKCAGTNTWVSQGVLKGDDGNGIVSITKTGTSGLVDTYTITYDDGDTDTFDVTNGENGSVWYKGTALTGTGTGITGFPGNQNDFYLNSSTGIVYTCTATGSVSTATWDYVMTLSGGGGGSVTVVDNLTTQSATDALSANQGYVLKGYVDGKIADPSTKNNGDVLTYNGSSWVAQAPSAGATSLAALTDTNISSPSNDQVLKYDGSSSKWVNGSAPASGHTMLPAPSGSVDEAAVVNAVTGGITEGGTNDDVASLYGIGKWSNTMTKTYKIQGIAGSSTPITQSGVGTFDMTGVDQTGWVTIPALIGAGSDPSLDIKLGFDPATVSVPITLGGWVVDDSTGKMCIKFGNEIPEADTHTALITVEVIMKRTEVSAVS